MVRLQTVLENFEQYPFLIQVIWIIVVVLFFNIIVFTFLLKAIRSKLRKKELFVYNYQKIIETSLIEYVYNENERNESDTLEAFFPEIIILGLSNQLKRKIILAIMVKLKSEISGEMAKPIEELFLKTQLFEFSKNKLNSEKWHVVAIGIKTLTIFKVVSVSDLVMKHVNHKRDEVRREAQLYFVNLFAFEGLDFLNKMKVSLSEWGQIQLLSVLNKFENQKIIGVENWLKSTNISVILFVLKLCRIYNLFEFKESILTLLKHKNKEVKIEVINLLSYFQVYEAKDVLKKSYDKLSVEERMVFFEMIEKLPEKEDLPFVLKYITDNNFQIKVSALRVLKILDLENFKKIETTKVDSEYKKIIDFVACN